jgi:hypothetical protein
LNNAQSTLLERIRLATEAAREDGLDSEVAHLVRLRDSLLGLPAPGVLTKHASPTHGTGTSQKVHGNWAHPGYTDSLDPKTGDLTVIERPGAVPVTQMAFFHPDLFDPSPSLPKPIGHSPNLDAPFTKATPHGDAFTRLDGKKFLLTRTDGPALSDGARALANVRLPGYIDNFREVSPAQAIIEMKAMREYLYEVEQYGIARMKERQGLGRLDAFTAEQKLQYNILSNHIEATRNEITAVFAHMDQMAGRALPEIERIGHEVRLKVHQAWVKAHGDLGLNIVVPVMSRATIRSFMAKDIANAFPDNPRIQELYGQYQEAIATPLAEIPNPKPLPIPEWVKVPRANTQITDYRPASSESPISLNRWRAKDFLDWHNSQDSLPGDTEWRPTDGDARTALFRWVKASDYQTLVDDAVRLLRADARAKHANRGFPPLEALRAHAHDLLPDRRKVVLEVLEAYRPFGGTLETLNQRTGKGLKHLNSESAYLPSDWIDISNHYGSLSVYSGQKRGHYNHDNEDWVSRLQAEVGSSGRAHVTLHEFAHRVEHTNPMVLALERHFYDKRTKGESLQPLQKLQPGRGYKAHEKSRPDLFLDPYKGKAYGQRGAYRTHRVTGQYWTTEAYELLSMGIYEAYTDKFAKDEDFMAFIYGTMVTA